MLTLKSYFHEVFSSKHEHKDGNREAYLPDIQPVRLLVNDRKFPAGNSVFLSHQTSQQ